jgi:quinol monooxygenase YgiN
MAKVHVIARFVAGQGKENQLRALLQGMLAPTRAESGCELYELYESDSKGTLLSVRKMGRSGGARPTHGDAAL